MSFYFTEPCDGSQYSGKKCYLRLSIILCLFETQPNVRKVNTNLVNEFLRKENVFAVVGVSENLIKYGHQVYKDLKEAGYVVYPVNPNINEVLGDRCYHSLSELPENPDVVDTVVPPEVTEKVVEECKALGIERVWMQPGSESRKAIEFCSRNDMKVVHDVCVMVKRRE